MSYNCDPPIWARAGECLHEVLAEHTGMKLLGTTRACPSLYICIILTFKLPVMENEPCFLDWALLATKSRSLAFTRVTSNSKELMPLCREGLSDQGICCKVNSGTIMKVEHQMLVILPHCLNYHCSLPTGYKNLSNISQVKWLYFMFGLDGGKGNYYLMSISNTLTLHISQSSSLNLLLLIP